MPPALDYASARLRPKRFAPPLATAAVLLAVGGATFAVYTAADAARRYLATFNGCAHGRIEESFRLNVVAPLACIAPAAAWGMSALVGAGAPLCRAALWAAVAAWLTANACTLR